MTKTHRQATSSQQQINDRRRRRVLPVAAASGGAQKGGRCGVLSLLPPLVFPTRSPCRQPLELTPHRIRPAKRRILTPCGCDFGLRFDDRSCPASLPPTASAMACSNPPFRSPDLACAVVPTCFPPSDASGVWELYASWRQDPCTVAVAEATTEGCGGWPCAALAPMVGAVALGNRGPRHQPW